MIRDVHRAQESFNPEYTSVNVSRSHVFLRAVPFAHLTWPSVYVLHTHSPPSAALTLHFTLLSAHGSRAHSNKKPPKWRATSSSRPPHPAHGRGAVTLAAANQR